jgi:hypothetical protein
VGSGNQDIFLLLQKRGRESAPCIVAIDALEHAVQSSDLSEPALTRILDAHRQPIELRATQKLNAGLLDSNRAVLIGADDIYFDADQDYYYILKYLKMIRPITM